MRFSEVTAVSADAWQHFGPVDFGLQRGQHQKLGLVVYVCGVQNLADFFLFLGGQIEMVYIRWLLVYVLSVNYSFAIL